MLCVLIAEEELRADAPGEVRDDDGAADGAAELMAMKVVGYRSEVWLGVEVAVAQEFEG